MLSFVFQPQRYSLQSYILKFDNRNTSVLFSFNKENINMLMLEIVVHKSEKKKKIDKDSRLRNKYNSLPFLMAAWKASSQVNTYPALLLTGRTEDGLSFWHYTWSLQEQITTHAESELALLALLWKQMLPSLTTARHHIAL